MRELACGVGTYWGRHLATPTRRAIRAKRGTVDVCTAGFSSSELANALAVAGCSVVVREVHQ